MRKDWKEIKTYYMTDPAATLRSAAQKFGVSMYVIARKSKQEGWFEERKKVQNRIIAKGITQAENRLARQLSKEADFLELMKGHVGRMLKDEDQFNRHLVETRTTSGDGSMTVDTEERIFDKFDARSLRDAMQVLQMMEAMTRSLYNIQRADALQKAQIDRERLELDKMKAEVHKPDTSAVIRIEGFEEGWDE